MKPPFSPDAVVAEFAGLLKAYGVLAVRGDRYGGAWPRERFCVHGIDYQIAGKSASDLYAELLPVLNSNRAELLDHARLVTQLCQLERHAGSGKDNIRHPLGGHDDIVNAVAGAIVMSLKAATQEVKSFPMPVVGGTPRYVPGGSSLAGDVVVMPSVNALEAPPAPPPPPAPAPAPPQPPSAAEREANRQRINNDRSIEHKVMGNQRRDEPWRSFVGGGGDSFFWGGATGRRAW